MTASEAQRIMRRHARSFALAAWFFSRRDRAAVAQLYALCRIVDDLADDADDPVEASCRLERIAAELTATTQTDPVARAATKLFAGKPEGLRAFRQLVEGVRGDRGYVAVADGRALRRYCSAVAGTVGVMICVLFDVDRRHHRAADALGRAMQLTNICRDVRADALMGRRYLPATLCARTPAQILDRSAETSEEVRKATALLLDEAEALYDEGLAALGALPLRLRLAVAVAASLYRGIGRRLHERNCDPLAGRVWVSRPRKAGLALVGLFAAFRPHPMRQSRRPINA